MGNFAKGGQQAREEAKKALPAFAKTNYFSLADGESVTIRLIDDSPDWIYIAQHGFVPTKGAPKDWESKGKDGAPAKKWPGVMNAVCRKARNEGELVFPEFEGKCFICDEMTGNPRSKNGKYYPSLKLWARAIRRDEIIGTAQMVQQGLIEEYDVNKVVGYQDRMIEVQDTDEKGEKVGEPRKVPDVVVINMGMKNFFGALQACYEAYGTVLDRDYKITRRGTELNTEYDIVPKEPIFEPNEKGKQVKFTLENEAVRAPYLDVVDLEAVITEQASDRHYATFFDTTQEIPTRGKAKSESQSTEDGVGTQAEAPASTANAEDLEAMRDRLMRSAT